MTKIVLTGGPCGGKSTALHAIRLHFEQKGYAVITVPETATELITAGVTPQNCNAREDFQRAQIELQYAKEQAFTQAAQKLRANRVLIVFDRGALDSLAYMPQESFFRWHDERGISVADRLSFYDGIFHLTSAAKGAIHAYTTKNNAARKETPEEASALDDRILSVWEAHPHVRVIDNNGMGFENKIARLLSGIEDLLSEQSSSDK